MATCGGIALCTTCLVKVLEGANQLAALADAEQDMLDTLPFIDDTIRLSCQLRVDEPMNNCTFKLIPE